MNKLMCAVISGGIGAILAFSTGAAESADATPMPVHIRLDIDLVDGSRIIGDPRESSVPLQTSYAQLDISFQQIGRLVLAKERETATLELRNGDRVTGILTLESINLETIMGTVEIGVEHIRSIQFVHRQGLGEEIREGLVLYCDFERNAEDKSGNNNHGVIKGTPRWVTGVSGDALEMSNKSSWVEFPREMLNPRKGDWSISLWLKLQPGFADNEGMVLGVFNAKGPGYAGAIWYQLAAARNANTGQLLFGMRSDAQSSQTVCRSITRLDDNQWRHLSLIRRGGATLEFWVDGELVNSVTNPELADVDVDRRDSYHQFDAALPAFLGYASAYDGSWLNGSVDSLRIYNRSLLPDEIQSLYQQR
jgi:hypothetical protein